MNTSVLCFRKIPVAKKIMDVGGGGVSSFSLESFFCLRMPKSFVGDTPVLCFRKFPVAKALWNKEGGYQGFPSEYFCLTMPKTFATESFCVVFKKTTGSEKLYG